MDVKAELDTLARRVDTALLQALEDVEPPSLRAACQHYPRGGGKRLRPAMALLAAEAVGGDQDDAMPLAVALELVHSFSLIHDDMMDDDETRRGLPAVHVEWDDATAILAGDTLFAKAFEVVSAAPAPADVRLDVLEDVATMTRIICEGQARDLEFEVRDPSEEEYLQMIDQKTARIFSSACAGGARLGGADDETVAHLRAFGTDFGLAFQVRDDLLDFLATTDQMGKPAASDVRAGKRTVIYLHARDHADDGELQVLDANFGESDASDKEVEAVLEVFRATGAIDHAQALVEARTEAALDHLATLPDSHARDLLVELTRWAAGREH